MTDKEEVVIVTNDRWIREGGLLDDDDVKMIQEAGDGARLISLREMLETMQKNEPDKFKGFKEHIGKQHGHVIKSMDELEAICKAADKRMTEFEGLTREMTLSQACQVRMWRMGKMTWRSIARAAFREGFFKRQWFPPSNQIMGMALCEKASRFFNEKYQEAPWN